MNRGTSCRVLAVAIRVVEPFFVSCSLPGLDAKPVRSTATYVSVGLFFAMQAVFLALRTTLKCCLTLNFVSASKKFSARVVPGAYPEHRSALRPQAVEEATATARVQAELRIAALQAQILELQAGG